MPRSGSSWSRRSRGQSGLGGMVGGQMLDLAAEGRFDATPPQARRAGGEDPAGDEDRRAAALRLSRRGHPGQGRSRPMDRARSLWLRARRSVPDRRRSPRPRRRSGDRRQGHRQGRGRAQGDAGRRARRRRRPSGGSTAWSPRRRRRSAPSAAMPTCSRPQRASSPHAVLDVGDRIGLGSARGIGTAGWPRTTDLRFHRPAL